VVYIGGSNKKPKIGEKMETVMYAAVGTPNRQNWLETRTLYGTSGKSIKNYKALPKLFAMN
jgi:hypothetical protein